MTVTQAEPKPLLLLFTSATSGRSRRAEGFLAQVLQRRQNHETFVVRQITRQASPEQFARFRIVDDPSLLVVDDGAVRARLPKITGVKEIEALLGPWLR